MVSTVNQNYYLHYHHHHNHCISFIYMWIFVLILCSCSLRIQETRPSSLILATHRILDISDMFAGNELIKHRDTIWPLEVLPKRSFLSLSYDDIFDFHFVIWFYSLFHPTLDLLTTKTRFFWRWKIKGRESLPNRWVCYLNCKSVWLLCCSI